MQKLEKLMELLKNNQKFNVTYKKGFANHLSMKLIALYFLNAGEHQLQNTYNDYAPHLEHIDHTEFEITGINWKQHLGTGEHYWSYYKFFRAKKSTLGIEEVLHEYLDYLFKGVVGGLFHPLIRLAYALDLWNYASSQDHQQLNSIAEEEAIIALAYMADSYTELPIYGEQDKKISVLLKLLQNEKNFPSKLSGIIERIKNVAAKNDAYKAYSNNIEVCPDDFKNLANDISDIYLKYQDFTLLHCVTSLHALRIVSDFLKKDEALKYYFHAFMAAYLSVDKVLSKKQPIYKYTAPDYIEDNISKVTDEHQIKLLYTASRELEFYKNENYQKIINLTLPE